MQKEVTDRSQRAVQKDSVKIPVDNNLIQLEPKNGTELSPREKSFWCVVLLIRHRDGKKNKSWMIEF